VLDLHSVPLPVARVMTHASGALGGVHARLAPNDRRIVELKFFDSAGLDIDTATERRIEGIFFREDYRRVYLDEIGRIQDASRVEETYGERFFAALRSDALEEIARGFDLVIDYANASVSTILPRLLRRMAVDVIELNSNLDESRIVQTTQQFDESMDRLARITAVVGASLGVRIDPSGEKLFLVDELGQQIGGMQSLLVFVALTLAANRGGAVAVPVTAPRAFEQVAERYGGRVIRTRATLGALMRTAAAQRELLLLGDGTGNYLFPGYYPIADGIFAVVKLMELLTLNGTTLSQVVRALPRSYLSQARVPCRWELKGKVMRLLNQQYADRRLDQIEGVRIELGDEWVLILPDPDGPFFHVIAEGISDEQARILAEKYAGLVIGLQ
jgi:mannose-1-phosphate guanylyltransferase/phosphomannomutase